MSLLVDTNVWSLAFRRDNDPYDPHVAALRDHLNRGEVITTGMIYLELLRGFTRRASRSTIEQSFAALSFIEPARADYAAAADLCITCRKAGVQFESVDALIAQVCISNNLTLLTVDTDFTLAARHVPFDVWNPV